ncbi:MAG: hypothetical protein Fur0041_00510 [Bacteroidia bacterium]
MKRNNFLPAALGKIEILNAVQDRNDVVFDLSNVQKQNIPVLTGMLRGKHMKHMYILKNGYLVKLALQEYKSNQPMLLKER